MNKEINELTDRVLEEDEPALGRLISFVEDREEGYKQAIKTLYPHTGDAHVLGVTGAPGSGKSTLVNRMSDYYLDRGLKLGILAVDPDSPYSGGAVLGDRIRFDKTPSDGTVFFRSMSTRGELGGLSGATNDVIRILDAFGMDLIIIETVGAGQNEVKIVESADTVLVLDIPGAGDDVQTLKAGILEIGDIFVVNKSDLPGADQTALELNRMVERTNTDMKNENWSPKIIKTVATKDKNIEELIERIDEHKDYLMNSNNNERKISRCKKEIYDILQDNIRREVRNSVNEYDITELAEQVANRNIDPYSATERLV